MNEKNIDALNTLLIKLGFDASIETALRCRICFSPVSFDLPFKNMTGEDACHFLVHVERGENELYQLLYYQAVLRKKINVPAELAPMDKRMAQIDWILLTGENIAAGSIDRDAVQDAYTILQELESMGGAAGILQYKYWIGTPLECMVQNLSFLRNQWEISEKFYLVDDAHVIAFAEATRFLTSKWMEKQMDAKRKLLVKKSKEEKSGAGGGNKLLLKIPKKQGRNLLKK